MIAIRMMMISLYATVNGSVERDPFAIKAKALYHPAQKALPDGPKSKKRANQIFRKLKSDGRKSAEKTRCLARFLISD
jgi:hypothetical protein